MFPCAGPATLGVKVTLKVTVLSAARVNGILRPLTENPGALLVIEETVTLVVPAFFILTCTLREWPTRTRAQLNGLGVMVHWTVLARAAEIKRARIVKATIRRAKGGVVTGRRSMFPNAH